MFGITIDMFGNVSGLRVNLAALRTYGNDWPVWICLKVDEHWID